MSSNNQLLSTHLRYWMAMAGGGILAIAGVIGFAKLMIPLFSIASA